jgi:hypothetical protein
MGNSCKEDALRRNSSIKHRRVKPDEAGRACKAPPYQQVGGLE